MATRILWLEDDKLPAIEVGLSDAGYIVDRAYFLAEGDEYLKKNIYGLVLMDVLMAVDPEDIAIGYNAKETNKGNKAGLAFYKRHCKTIADMSAAVIVYSVVSDEDEIREGFKGLGVPESNILYKVSESSVSDLLGHIKRVLRTRSDVSQSAQNRNRGVQ